MLAAGLRAGEAHSVMGVGSREFFQDLDQVPELGGANALCMRAR